MHSFAWWPVVIVVVVATATDLRSRRIPNWLVLPFLVLGIAVSGWVHGGHGIAASLEGMALGLVVFGALFWAGGMGAGDVKLCAAIGAWIGPQQLFLALILISLAGGLMALGWAIGGGFTGELFRGTGDLVFGWRKHRAVAATESVPGGQSAPAGGTVSGGPLRRKIPYAPAIAIGTLLSFFAR